jgi:5'-nucleotidase
MKKIVYVDMDGVIADFDGEIKKYYPNLELLNAQERSDKVDEICKQNPNIFYDLQPIPGAIEAVKKLFKRYDVLLLSTAMWEIPESFIGKRIWVEKHFGDLIKKRLILSHRKNLNMGAYLIDDRTKNGAGKFVGVHIHFGSKKFPHWKSVLEHLHV